MARARLSSSVPDTTLGHGDYDNQASSSSRWIIPRRSERSGNAHQPVARSHTFPPTSPAMMSPDSFEQQGCARTSPGIVIAEGLTMYLTADEAEKTFADVAVATPRGSRLAANFVGAGGGSVAPLSRAVAKLIRARWRVSGEPMYHWAATDRVTTLLAAAGWQQTERLGGPDVATRFLSETSMTTSGLNPDSFCVGAVRADT
jgi:O-methyltransferase involved in polyketide biosynthesis